MAKCKTHGDELNAGCVLCFRAFSSSLKTDADLLDRIKKSVLKVKESMYEHGLHGAQASSYVDGVCTYGEPVLEACLDAIDTAAKYDPRTDVNKEQAATARARRLVDRAFGDDRHIIDLLCDEIERLRKGVMPNAEQLRLGVHEVTGDDASVKQRMPYLTFPPLGDPWMNPRLGGGK